MGALVGLAVAIAGCDKIGVHGTVLPNMPPTVELTQVPAPTDTAGTYAYEVSWAGFDADGRIAFFEYAVDPPGEVPADTPWVKTTANRKTFFFRSDSVSSGGAVRARGFHTVVVRCQDDEGARSPTANASFTSTTLAPTVQITLPQPNDLLARPVPGVVRIEWRGDDPDGVGSREPVQYKFKLFGANSEFTPTQARGNPDAVRRRYAPSFAEWDSVPGNVRAASLHDLVPGREYVFVVVAIDQAGAYSPVFNSNINMLYLRVDPSLLLGPTITVSSPTFTYTYPSGGYFKDPSFYLHVEFPADLPIQLGWSAKPAPGGFIRGYRWGVDILRLDDETPRSDEATDLAHWSRQSTLQNVVLPPYSTGGGLSAQHFFYLEAEDDLNQKSLAVIQFVVVSAAFDRDLLIVDDTFLTPDRASTGGCVLGALGVWPSAAELDTFLYAAGNKTWRCYPTGSRSPVGLFAGYAYDTLGTHFTTTATLNLQRLDRYRNIIWMADLNSALNYTDGYNNSSSRPRPLLYEWCSPGVASPLATWLLQGGRLWMMGGGSAMASLRPYDAPRSPNNIFSSEKGELGPGRIMYDQAHWKSEIRVLRSIQAVRSPRAVGEWPGAPDYSALPEVLMEKNIATDPLPPLRNNYAGSYFAEHLFKPNSILERGPNDGPGQATMAALDTLYETAGGEAGSGWPVMTIYHGKESPLFVFSGFPIWYFQRTQAIDLLDFVLQRVWGMNRKPVTR